MAQIVVRELDLEQDRCHSRFLSIQGRLQTLAATLESIKTASLEVP